MAHTVPRVISRRHMSKVHFASCSYNLPCLFSSAPGTTFVHAISIYYDIEFMYYDIECKKIHLIKKEDEGKKRNIQLTLALNRRLVKTMKLFQKQIIVKKKK